MVLVDRVVPLVATFPVPCPEQAGGQGKKIEYAGGTVCWVNSGVDNCCFRYFLKIVCKIEKVKMGNVKKILGRGPIITKRAITTLILAGASLYASAQDGNAGIDAANDQVRNYFDSGTNLMYAVGALLGLIGAVKVYQKWNAGDPDTSKVAAAWFGSCVFLVVVVTVIKSFFAI